MMHMTMMTEYSNKQRQLLLHLSLIPGVGPALLQKICSSTFFITDPTILYTLSTTALRTGIACSEQQALTIIHGLKNTALLHNELQLMERFDISWFTIDNPLYPSLLRHIHLPPMVLFCKGTLPTSTHVLAVVGSRNATAYGLQIIDSFIPSCIKDNWLIISGGARGIDSAAHWATLKASGTTIAVVGSGILQPYPTSNKRLFDEIVANGGALISSFSAQTPALAGNFPARNRIISGLSQGCLVIQAAEKSGALITAHYALDQGREVLAVPGSIFDPSSAGCNKLIQEGAHSITNPQDIATVFGLSKQSINTTVPQQLRIESLEFQEILPQSPKELIVRACKTPQSIDALCELTSLSHQELNALLFDLQLDGSLEQTFAGLWQQI